MKTLHYYRHYKIMVDDEFETISVLSPLTNENCTPRTEFLSVREAEMFVDKLCDPADMIIKRLAASLVMPRCEVLNMEDYR